MTEPVYEDTPTPPAGADPVADPIGVLTAMLTNLPDEQLDTLISDLESLRASRHATAQATRVEHQPGATEVEAEGD